MNWPHTPQTATLTAAQALVASPGVTPRAEPEGLPSGDHKITFNDARRLVARRQRAAQVSGGAFHKEALLRLLAQTSCAGLRFYHAMEPDGRPTVVLVGIDENGEELLDGELLEHAYPCPPICPTGPSLRGR